MRKIITISVLIGALLAGYKPIFAQTVNNRWQFMGDSSNDSRLFLDKDIQKLADGRRRTWTKEIFRDGSYKIARAEWRCRRQQYRILEATNYAPEGNFISRESNTDWHAVVPDSVSENYFRTICAGDEIEAVADEDSSSDKRKTVLVITNQAKLRQMPSATSQLLRTLLKGTRLILADEVPHGAWYEVIIPDSEQIGWLHGNAIKIVETASSQRRSKGKTAPTTKNRARKSN